MNICIQFVIDSYKKASSKCFCYFLLILFLFLFFFSWWNYVLTSKFFALLFDPVAFALFIFVFAKQRYAANRLSQFELFMKYKLFSASVCRNTKMSETWNYELKTHKTGSAVSMMSAKYWRCVSNEGNNNKRRKIMDVSHKTCSNPSGEINNGEKQQIILWHFCYSHREIITYFPIFLQFPYRLQLNYIIAHIV